MVSFGALLASGSVQGRTGRLLVQSDDPAALLTRSDVSRIEVRPSGLVWVWPARGVDDLTLARALHGQPGIGWVNPDLILPTQPHTLPDDPFYPDQWHLDNTGQGGRTPGVDINAPRAWERVTGAGVLIAIIDTGMVLDHPDLRVTAGYDYIDDDADPTPTSGDMSADPHGTCAGGVAAAAGNNGLGVAGVAWGADLYAIRLIGGGASLSSIYDAFIEAVDAGAGVVNNSWGWGDSCADIRNYAVFRDMFEYAETEGRGGLGTVVVFSAGNGACDIFGLLSLDIYEGARLARAAVSSRYLDRLAAEAPPGLIGPAALFATPDYVANHSYFPVRVLPESGTHRDAVVLRLRESGVHARKYFHPTVPTASIYAPLVPPEGLPRTAELSRSVICLPIHHNMEAEDCDIVMDALLAAVRSPQS